MKALRPASRHSVRGTASRAALSFLASALAGTCVLLAALWLRPEWFGRAPVDPRGADPAPVQPAAPAEPSGTRVFAHVQPSVVHITTRAAGRSGIFRTEVEVGTGSGLVWDRAGHVVTCDHLFDEDTTSAIVTLWNGAQYEARLVGRDVGTDVAVVRIGAPAGELVPIDRPEAGFTLEVGEEVFAVGCPYGLAPSLTRGVVSGLDRLIRAPSGAVLDAIVQTDAALHPGTSGGALADAEGRVVGMNAALQEDARSLLGLGFAQRIDQVAEVVERTIETGLVWSPELGFSVFGEAMSAEYLALVHAAAGGTSPAPHEGLIVIGVDAGGRAERAGLRVFEQVGRDGIVEEKRVRDVLVAVGETRVTSRAELVEAIAALDLSGPVVVTVARLEGEVQVTL